MNFAPSRATRPWCSPLGLSSIADSAGLRVKALNAEISTEMAMVSANCWYRRPVIPGMKATGMNTEESTRAMPTTGAETSSIALSVASLGESPWWMCDSTASTTTIASSTTRPIARISPKSERVLSENPSMGKTANVPTSETGTASSGMRVARQLWRKMKTTMITRTIASRSVFTISCIPSTMGRVVSSATS